ncbi:MAG: phosphate ABC transporter permease subunit PstC [Dehalococcoidia bacterium]|nr:phosphate ABC transporter permease subunit PstC [Dehalococcoidia bacterium]
MNMSDDDLSTSKDSNKHKVKKINSHLISRFIAGLLPNFTRFCAFVVAILLLFILIVLFIEAWDAIRINGWSFITSSTWDPVKGIYGALPAIFGTLLTSFLALLIAVPASFGAAIFLSEIAPSKVKNIASFIIEMIAAIPSVIIGLWGIRVLVPFMADFIQPWLSKILGFLPFFSGQPTGYGFLTSSVILAIMIIPIITSMSREVLRSVPNSQREAMLALGATKWETISRVVLPYGNSGLVGAIILGLGRALGETMAVAMVIGNSPNITFDLFSGGMTIATKIASEFGESGGQSRETLIELALVLFVIALLVNVIARLLVWRATKVKTEKG